MNSSTHTIVVGWIMMMMLMMTVVMVIMSRHLSLRDANFLLDFLGEESVVPTTDNRPECDLGGDDIDV